MTKPLLDLNNDIKSQLAASPQAVADLCRSLRRTPFQIEDRLHMLLAAGVVCIDPGGLRETRYMLTTKAARDERPNPDLDCRRSPPAILSHDSHGLFSKAARVPHHLHARPSLIPCIRRAVRAPRRQLAPATSKPYRATHVASSISHSADLL